MLYNLAIGAGVTQSQGRAIVLAAALLLVPCSATMARCQSVPLLPADHPQTSLDFKDADAILRIAVPRTLANRRQAMAHTYAVDYRNRNYAPRGKLIADYQAKYDVIFVAGMPYRRQVEENGKPLTGQEAIDEARRYDQAFAERSRMSLEEKRDYLRRPWNLDVPLPQLVALFNNRVVGGSAVDGRAAIVLESIPRAGAQPTDEEEQRALHKRVKLWIDEADLVVSRIEATLVADDAGMKAGTVAHIDFVRKDGLWLPAQSDVRFQVRDGRDLILGETTESNAGFQRFRVDVRLLEPAQTAGEASPKP